MVTMTLATEERELEKGVPTTLTKSVKELFARRFSRVEPGEQRGRRNVREHLGNRQRDSSTRARAGNGQSFALMGDSIQNMCPHRARYYITRSAGLARGGPGRRAVISPAYSIPGIPDGADGSGMG